MNIAIDGPAGAGKSTIAKKLAEKYQQAGYETEIRFPPYGKDFNEFLQRERNQDLCRQPQEQKAR